jgi:hypothetical protein
VSSLSTPASQAPDPLLLLLDPEARRFDGESVRIARDVLSGGADVKLVAPESLDELDRALARRGRRRPVVIGGDLAVRRALQVLHRQRELGAEPVGVVPVGRSAQIERALALGVPKEPVAAARAVINGTPHKLDLLLDDCGGVVLGEVRILAGARTPARTGGWRSLWAKSAAAEQATGPRLRIEADGLLLAEPHQPLHRLEAALGEGSVGLSLLAGDGEVRLRAERLTVAGRDFDYEADGCPAGPVRSRTWTVHAACWELMLPGGGDQHHAGIH